jgi:hypothetical protein
VTPFATRKVSSGWVIIAPGHEVGIVAEAKTKDPNESDCPTAFWWNTLIDDVTVKRLTPAIARWPVLCFRIPLTPSCVVSGVSLMEQPTGTPGSRSPLVGLVEGSLRRPRDHDGLRPRSTAVEVFSRLRRRSPLGCVQDFLETHR